MSVDPENASGNMALNYLKTQTLKPKTPFSIPGPFFQVDKNGPRFANTSNLPGLPVKPSLCESSSQGLGFRV